MPRLLIPLCFRDAEERAFFQEGPGLRTTGAVLDAVVHSGLGHRALVLADSAAGRALAQAHGLASAEAEQLPTQTSAATAPGTVLTPDLEAARSWALAHLAADETMLAVSPRAPLTTPEMLEQAAHMAGSAQEPVLSVTTPRDHPAQLCRNMMLCAEERLLLLEPEETGKALRSGLGLGPERLCSRAFPLDPGLLPAGTHPEDTLYSLEMQHGQAVLLPAGPDAPAQTPLWHISGSARIFVDAGSLAHEGPGRAAGISLPGPGRPAQLRLTESGGQLRLCWPDQVPSQNALARVILLRQREGALATMNLSPDGSQAFPLPGPEIFGALCLYLCQTHDGFHDVTLPFLPDDTLWRIDPTTLFLENAVSGRAICGRQDFMEVLQPDGALLLAAHSVLAELPHRLQSGGFTPFLIAPENSLRVETIHDVLLAEVRCQMREEGA
jgi:hypothetical protein